MFENKIDRAKAFGLALVVTLCIGAAALQPSAAFAQSALVNTATVTPPAGVVDVNPADNTASATVDISAAAVAHSFCAAPGGSATSNGIYNIVNGVAIWRLEPATGIDSVVPELALPTVSGNVNALMIDPVRDRLLFHATNGSMLWAYDADNGGWYQALTAAIPTSDLPRAGMNGSGVGYMIGSGASPVVYRVASSGGFAYTAQNIGILQYDVAPTDPGSGDIAFDADGFGWLAAGQDLYRVDFSAPGNPQAIRQIRPLLDGNASTVQWAGVAFADDGRLYVANNSNPSRYFIYDPATGSLSVAGPTAAGGARDLASCALPQSLEPELSAQKVLAEVNGQAYVAGTAVSSGDTLTYAITVTNNGGAVGTLFAGDAVETVPANTTFVAAGNDFTCTGATCPNTAAVNVPANGGVSVLNFVVRINTPMPAGVTGIANTVTFPGLVPPRVVDCGVDGGDCNVVTPLGPMISVVKRADPVAGTAVASGATLTYTLTVTVANAATLSDVVLTDTLGEGLTFVETVDDGDFIGDGTGSVRTYTLPAGALPGSHVVTYTATVDAAATTSVTNTVTGSGGGDPGNPDAPDPDCTTCTTEHPLATGINVSKSADPASGSEVSPGDTLTYTLTTVVSSSATTEVLTLTDTLGPGLTFGDVTDAGVLTCSGALSCTLPAGTLPGTYTLTYTATVDSDATGTVGNVVTATNPPGGTDPDPVCTTCSTEHEVVPTSITVSKSADPASGSEVSPGDTLTYTLTTVVSSSATTEVLTLTDTLGTGLTFGDVTDAGVLTCSGALTCTLPVGTQPGTYTLTYTATVDSDATGTVGNVVTATNPPGGTDPDPVCTTCSTEHEVVPTSITVSKSADPASGSEVSPGDTLTYTLTTVVSSSATTEVLTLTDTLGTGLTFGDVIDAGVLTCSGTLTCTLPVGTQPGTYTLTYTATVDSDATGTVGNVVTATTPPGGTDPDPVCTTCSTEHQVVAPTIAVTKTSDPASGTDVRAGETITYALSVTVGNSATRDVLTLTDTLGTGLTFGEVTDAGVLTCSGALTCTLPAGTLPGTYALTYTATVDADATTSVGNSVVASGGTGDGGPPPVCTVCSTDHPLLDPRVVIAKAATPGEGQEVRVGDTIDYTLRVTVENSATLSNLRLIDTPSTGLVVGALPAGCSTEGADVVCTMPAGTVPGIYTFVYPAMVTADARGEVRNVVLGLYSDGDGDIECTVCETRHVVLDEVELRLVKSVGARRVAIGDLVRYTVTVQNVGAVNVVGGNVIDTPPAGFSYVEGSMAVADRDAAFTLDGQAPMRVGGLDIAAGEEATIVYLLRVGAGVRQGVHLNEAVAVDADGTPVSNIATAQVLLDADPMLDDSLIFGTVFDDRDGDGWQDRADLTGVRVQGGFSPAAYIAGSTTIDRGAGPQAVADASAPLLHGIDVDGISARQSEADPPSAHQVVIRQRLHALEFTEDFVFSSAQGVEVRMDAAGNTRVSRSGEAAKGLTAAMPVVEREVAAIDGGYEVAYRVTNHGVDERGIPGVRIASVEGLLIETDQYGRYHLADVQGGDGRHGRNFILKVDPATLPSGAVFTTANPLLRRITPGIPVRFDFGIKLPVRRLPAGTERVELTLGEVLFAPGSAEIRAAHLPAISRMAEPVTRYGGGDVVITADGSSEGLAFARAAAVRDALQAQLGAAAQAGLTVVLRTDVDDPHTLVAGVDAGGALLGSVLFETDRAAILPAFDGLLDAVAQRLEQLGGGVVVLVGHTDVRGPHAYNAALGLRRATAVQQALAMKLSPEVRSNVRVEASRDPAAAVGTERK